MATFRLFPAYLAILTLVLTDSVYAQKPSKDIETYWPQWRGPLCNGVAPKANPPTEWSEKKNVRWKVELPGLGHATPVIWGDTLYVLTAAEKKSEPDSAMDLYLQDPEQPRERRRRPGFARRPAPPSKVYQFQVLALDRKTGKIRWTTTVREEKPHEAGHTDSTHASPSPVTDGKHLYAHFGSRGLYCLDLKGNIKWEVDLGDMRTRNEFGEGSSPALHGDTLVVNWDHEGDSFIVALDAATGKERWRVERDEPTSWSTPLILEVDGKPQVIVSATNYIRSYDLATGKEVWRCGGMTANAIPTPIAGNGLLYCLSGFRGNALLAIRYEKARGDITDSPAVVWTHDRDTPYVPSALLYDDSLYFLDHNKAILSCFDAKTGKPRYDKQRLPGLEGVYASPVGAGGRVYIAGRNGKTVVLRHAKKFEVLATNELEDGFDASPAIAGDELYLRGRKALYCIAAK